jgi:hypothetical protein
MPEPSLSPTPQFTTAEYSGTTTSVQCRFCGQSIPGSYYLVNGAMACPSCAERAQRETPKASHAQFVRAIIFGAVAASGGIILYAAFGIITGWMIGYISLAVGYMVGKAMMKGSKGFGGRRYQVAAVLLTYAAVSLGETTIGISQYIKQEKAQKESQQTSSKNAQSTPDQSKQPLTPGRFIKALGFMLVLGLVFPFLELQDPVHGLIGLFILFIGLQIAWKLTAGSGKVAVDGPYGQSTSPATS